MDDGTPPYNDVIRVKNLLAMASFRDGAQWPSDNPKSQPVNITLDIAHDVSRTAATDDLVHSIDYSAVCKTLTASCGAGVFSSLEALCEEILRDVFASHPQVQEVILLVTRLRGLLHPATTTIRKQRKREGIKALRNPDWEEEILLSNLEYRTIVGINDCEREDAQLVHFNLRLICQPRGDAAFGFRELERRISAHITGSSYLTLEALAASVAQLTLEFAAGYCRYVTVRGSKPSALVCAEGPEVEVTRSLKDGELVPHAPSLMPRLAATVAAETTVPPPKSISEPQESAGKAVLAIGSNLGDRFAQIELALRILETRGIHYSTLPEDGYVNVLDTSFMYETEPMYVTDQPKFINCACTVETNLKPLELLNLVKKIESIIGRVATFRNGPRPIDLDILLYESRVIDTRPLGERSASLGDLDGHLVVPHPRMAEREFVLRPLNDIFPNFIHPVLGLPIRDLLTALVKSQPPGTAPMYRVLPFPRYPSNQESFSAAKLADYGLQSIAPVPPTLKYWKFPVSVPTPLPNRLGTGTASEVKPRSNGLRHKTYIMGTLNVTPDSFSDGSVNNTVLAALQYTQSAVEAGADILDIGGYSTRPGASYVGVSEEIERVVPIIQAIRSQNQSIETTTSTTTTKRPNGVLISVDTFRWEVAEAAVRAGANCINDVYAFRGSSEYAANPDTETREAEESRRSKMKQIARDLAVPVILMHSRGEASANKDYSEYDYATDSPTAEGIRVELGERVLDLIVKGKGGVRRWFVVVDPGVGFSKTTEGNLEVIRHARSIVDPTIYVGSPSGGARRLNPLGGFPLLVGASRKSFLGALLEKPDEDQEGSYQGRETKPTERDFATAAVVASVVQQRAEIVRVHNVLNLGDVVRIASFIAG